MNAPAGTVRAVGVTTYGGPDALQVAHVPTQELGPTDVRVRVTAATINPTDTYTRNGSRSKTGAPRGVAEVPGMDIAGTLVEIGDDAATALAVGDRVMGIVIPRDEHGAYRDAPRGRSARADTMEPWFPRNSAHGSSVSRRSWSARASIYALRASPTSRPECSAHSSGTESPSSRSGPSWPPTREATPPPPANSSKPWK